MKTTRYHFGACLFVALAFFMSPLHADEASDMVLGPDGKLAMSKPAATPPKTAFSESPAGGADTLRVAGTALFLTGMVVAAVLWLRHSRKEKHRKNSNAASLEVMGRLSLGPRREVILVRAGEQVLVLGSTNNDLNLLASLPKPQPEDKELDPATFDEFYRKYTGKRPPQRSAASAEPVAAREGVEVDWPQVSAGGRP